LGYAEERDVELLDALKAKPSMVVEKVMVLENLLSLETWL
jgi:hypothetical protein